jgi:hypothetical protein
VVRSIACKNVLALPVSVIAFILWQLHHPDSDDNIESTMDKFGSRFILSFVDFLPRTRNSACWEENSSGDLLVLFKFRWMAIGEHAHYRVFNQIENATGDDIEPGMRSKRGHGSIPGLKLGEMRHALAMRTTTCTRLPLYTMVKLFDDNSTTSYREAIAFTRNRRWARFQVSRCGSLTGVAAFLVEISICLKAVVKMWAESLDALDRNLSINVSAAEHIVLPLTFFDYEY